jgi:uncharacterized protein YbbC (DUF1343 family)/CubicO group peptidase (beta-lactamase class C family)
MKIPSIAAALLAALALSAAWAVLQSEADIFPPRAPEKMSAISEIVAREAGAGRIPGAVVLVGGRSGVLYRQAFGYRSLVPEVLPMTSDTIFDISSLTKVVATSTAVMQLAEMGKLELDRPVVKYWAEFRRNGKNRITVRHLLTHYSGLRADLDLMHKWSGRKAALKLVAAEKPLAPPGTRFIYSDINFIVLGELVRRVSGQELDAYCEEHIFKPLGMRDTAFNPSSGLRGRIAPTEYANGNRERLLWGEVHDPTARRMGGVAGHAGLFSTADDLSIFARMVLDNGRTGEVGILSPLTVKKMTTPESPPGKKILRGLGWDIDSPYSSCRGALFPVGSFGHTGFTGASLWIDPISKTYVIILTSRLHPDGKGNAGPLRSEIATLVAAALGFESDGQTPEGRHALTGYSVQGPGNSKVQTGIDVLKAENFRSLTGLSIGLITNHSGIDSSGRRTLDVFYNAPGVRIRKVFSPEHGLFGKEEERVPSTMDAATGIPVYSLYGEVKRPTDRMLDGLDALVFDVQDAGVRFYTYVTTMGYAMEAAAKRGISFYVLDRPNPITASVVQGFVMDDDLRSFTGYFTLPIRHGMTVGELARMFNTEKGIGVKLQVIKMRGYERTDWYDETGLHWVKPSPNLRTLGQTVLYPGVAMVEGSNVSVGRGTDTPFELLGAPWIDAKALASYMNGRKIPGVRFSPTDFTPFAGRFKNRRCHGIHMLLLDRRVLDPTILGVEIISALHKLYPKDFNLDETMELIASRQVLDAVRNGEDPGSIAQHWQGRLDEFRKLREKYLLY